jgi:hypothetical protein
LDYLYLKAIEVLMPTDTLDPSKAALASLDDTSAALKAVKNLVSGGRNSGVVLRKMFGTCDPEQAPVGNARAKASKSLENLRPGALSLTPGL